MKGWSACCQGLAFMGIVIKPEVVLHVIFVSNILAN